MCGQESKIKNLKSRIWNHAAQPPTGRHESPQPTARSLPCYGSAYSSRRRLFLIGAHRYESFKSVKIICNSVPRPAAGDRDEPYPINAFGVSKFIWRARSAAMVFAWRRPSPVAERCSIRLEDFDLERVARRNIARMGRTAVSTGTGRQSSKQIDLREKLDEVAGANGTCLHEILVRVLREPGAHEDVEHVVDMMLHRARFRLQFGGKRTRQVGMTGPANAGQVNQTPLSLRRRRSRCR